MELPLLPKRARFLSEPPPNRLQISAQTTALPTMIRADGQVENKGKPHPKHLNSFYLKCERSPAFSCGRLHNTLLESAPLTDHSFWGRFLQSYNPTPRYLSLIATWKFLMEVVCRDSCGN